jgi:tetratricopeptide (TPR) repeat protein
MGRNSVVCGLLALAVLAVYGQVASFEYVGWDDDLYVGEESRAPQGLTTEGAVWAFSTGHAANWHPLTWLSHMLDFELFGRDPGAHHLVNVLLHLVNALLLFGALRLMTRALWLSALVAALFALHPLHVESVAWVAERKDVLSTAFGLLAILAYTAWVRRGGLGLYLATACAMALSLLAKPMLVTLPFVFLLLDYWPLGRLRPGPRDGDEERGEDREPEAPAPPARPLKRLLLEKAPLLVLSVASSVVTFLMQRNGGAVGSTEVVSLAQRAGNALVSYVVYAAKTAWPSDLSILYPHPYLPDSGALPLAGWQVAGSALLLGAASLLVFRTFRRRYALVGWLWYLGTLVPVIGLVQVGGHALADRYTYVPLIGLFVIVAWGGAELATALRERHERLGRAVTPAVVSVLAALAVCSWVQTRHWRDSIALFEHALEVTPRNRSMSFNLGNELRRKGRPQEAIFHYRAALWVKPNDVKVHNNLGLALWSQGEQDEAMRHYREALDANPAFAEARGNLANALRSRGELDEAVEQYHRALRDKPQLVQAQNGLGIALRAQGRLDEAIVQYREALEIEPDYAEAHTNLGLALQSQGKLEEAVRQHRQALRFKPELAAAHNNLGIVLESQGQLDETVGHYREALRIAPGLATAHHNLGNALRAQGNLGDAIRHYEEALRIDPAHAAAQENLEIAVGMRGRLQRARGED